MTIMYIISVYLKNQSSKWLHPALRSSYQGITPNKTLPNHILLLSLQDLYNTLLKELNREKMRLLLKLTSLSPRGLQLK